MSDPTRIKPPHELFLKALPFVTTWENILDIGAGYLNETRYLLDKGHAVTAIDRNPLPEILVPKVSEKLTYVQTDFHVFIYPQSKYDFIIALFSLSFTEPEQFPQFFAELIESLAVGGVLVGNVFSSHDGWKKEGVPHITFLTKEEVLAFFDERFEVILSEDHEWDGQQYNGELKHWHTVNFIVRRIS
jgi:SAM-dependent methyltransferase